MQYHNFQINVNVLTSDGRNVTTGAVVSFSAFSNKITPEEKIPCDLSWWASASAQTNNWDKITACTDAVDRTGTRLINAYLQIDVPVTDLTYEIIQGYAETFLEGIYGVGNITILN